MQLCSDAAIQPYIMAQMVKMNVIVITFYDTQARSRASQR